MTAAHPLSMDLVLNLLEHGWHPGSFSGNYLSFLLSQKALFLALAARKLQENARADEHTYNLSLQRTFGLERGQTLNQVFCL